MQTTRPETLGFSRERLARLDAAMQRYIDDKKLAGIITLIARRGQIVHLGKFGMANIAAGQPMADDTIFRIYSMTKPITSVAALMLMEEGRLRLSDPVSRYIPAFRDIQVLENPADPSSACVACTHAPTLKELFTHTAGLSYGFEAGHIDDLYRQRVWGLMRINPDVTLAEFVNAIAAVPLACQPGTRFIYSMATDVLGRVVEVAADMPFAEFLRERIFQPLGMTDTDFWVPQEKAHRLAALYSRDEAGALVEHNPTPFRYDRPTQNPSRGGGLVSTTGDYFRFAQMLLNRGELDGVRLLGRKTVEWMTTNHLPDGVHPNGDPAMGFGLGVSVLLDPGKAQVLGSVGTFGWGGAANTGFWVDPQEELIGIIMLQFMPSGTYPVIPDFRNLAYAALEGAASAQPSAVSK